MIAYGESKIATTRPVILNDFLHKMSSLPDISVNPGGFRDPQILGWGIVGVPGGRRRGS